MYYHKNSSTNQNYKAKQGKHGQNIYHPQTIVALSIAYLLIHISDNKKGWLFAVL